MFKLIDLKRKARKARELESVPPTTGKEKPYYLYSLGITLEDKELRKLNKSLSDFKVGDDVNLVSKARVTSTRQSDEEFGDSRRSVGLQLRKLALK